jgi:hypothetical protein
LGGYFSPRFLPDFFDLKSLLCFHLHRAAMRRQGAIDDAAQILPRLISSPDLRSPMPRTNLATTFALEQPQWAPAAGVAPSQYLDGWLARVEAAKGLGAAASAWRVASIDEGLVSSGRWSWCGR